MSNNRLSCVVMIWNKDFQIIDCEHGMTLNLISYFVLLKTSEISSGYFETINLPT